MWQWITTNAYGEAISVNWANETRLAIEAIVKDVYSTPLNSVNGEAQFLTPLEARTPIGVGRSQMSAEGVEISVLTHGFASEDDYHVFLNWQEDQGLSAGEFRISKTAQSFLVTVTGSATGKKFSYQIFKA